MTSITSCFGKTERQCKYPCQLEYRADDESGKPVCVPNHENLYGTELSRKEIQVIKRIISNILPKVDASEIDGQLKTLHRELSVFIDIKISNEVTMNRYSSWVDLVRNVSVSIANEIEMANCAVCMENLNDKSGGKVITTKCCSNVIHESCRNSWIKERNQCVLCGNNEIYNRIANGLLNDVQNEFDNDLLEEDLDH